MTCPQCHRPVSPDARFCGKCNFRLAGAATTSGPATPPPPPEPTRPWPTGADTSTAPVPDDDFLPPIATQGSGAQSTPLPTGSLAFSRNGDVETSFANLVSGKDVLRHALGLLVIQVLWFLVSSVLGFLFLVGVLNGVDPTSAALDPGAALDSVLGALTAMGLVFFLIGVALLVVPLFARVQTPMSEWQIYLDERSTSVDAAYRRVQQALARRNVPARVQPVRMSHGAGAVGEHLVVSQRPYSAYVNVFPYGTGLYLSWSLWREQRAGMLYVEWVRRLARSFAGEGSLLNDLMRAEPARALREAVHNAVRDGVEAAVVDGDSSGSWAGRG